MVLILLAGLVLAAGCGKIKESLMESTTSANNVNPDQTGQSLEEQSIDQAVTEIDELDSLIEELESDPGLEDLDALKIE